MRGRFRTAAALGGALLVATIPAELSNGIPQDFNFPFRGGFLALSLFERAENFIQVVQRLLEIGLNVEDIVDEVANSPGRFLGAFGAFLSRRQRRIGIRRTVGGAFGAGLAGTTASSTTATTAAAAASKASATRVVPAWFLAGARVFAGCGRSRRFFRAVALIFEVLVLIHRFCRERISASHPGKSIE